MRIVAKPNLNSFANNACLKDAIVILGACHDSVLSFYDAYKKLRTQRRGRPTDIEQDLLRAMLLFAASGLDATIKQLINDGLEEVISKQEGSKIMFSKFVERKIKKNERIEEESRERMNLDSRYIAEILINENPRNKLIIDMQKDLSKESLQSFPQIATVGSYFDIDSKAFDENLVVQAFKVRNEITHEMDIDINGSGRRRRARRVTNMVKYTNTLITVGESFIKSVASKLD